MRMSLTPLNHALRMVQIASSPVAQRVKDPVLPRLWQVRFLAQERPHAASAAKKIKKKKGNGTSHAYFATYPAPGGGGKKSGSGQVSGVMDDQQESTGGPSLPATLALSPRASCRPPPAPRVLPSSPSPPPAQRPASHPLAPRPRGSSRDAQHPPHTGSSSSWGKSCFTHSRSF